MAVDERNVSFEIVGVQAFDQPPSDRRIVVMAIGRSTRLSGLRLQQTYSIHPYSRGRLAHLLSVVGVEVDAHGGFRASELVGRSFLADVGEDNRVGFFWHSERAA